MKPPALRNILLVLFLCSLAGLRSHGGPVFDLITNAKTSSPAESDGEVSILFLEAGLRELAEPETPPPDREAIVNEALYILTNRFDTEDVLAGLMRGLAIIRESTNTQIAASLCFFATDPSSSLRLQTEAWESLRIRCLNGEGDPDACNCYSNLPPHSNVGIEPPAPTRLSIQPAGTNIVLSWPSSTLGYQLEVNSDLAQPNGWTPVTGPLIQTNGYNTITILLDFGPRFYRLRR